jgi:alpha-amylase
VLNIGGETTAIEVKGVKGVKDVKDDAWYDMSDRRLDGKPAQPGIYIHAGRKVVIYVKR